MMSTVAETATLAWGYTMAEVDRLTRLACLKSRKVVTMDLDDLNAAVWFAIVEALYLDSPEYPTHKYLIAVGNRAAAAANLENNQAHGFDVITGQTRARFTTYWGSRSTRGGFGADDGFSERVVENMALPQVLSRLSAVEYEVLASLAAHGAQRPAAEAIGMTLGTFERHLRDAREHAKELWFEPETPRSARPYDPDYACPHGHTRAEHGYWREKTNNWDCKACARASKLKRSRKIARLADPENDAA